jgi:hypothetical protein
MAASTEERAHKAKRLVAFAGKDVDLNRIVLL